MSPHDRTLRAAPVRFAAVYLIAILLAPLLAVTVPRGLAPLLIAASIFGTVMFRLDQGRWPVPPVRWMLLLGGFLAYCASSALWSIKPAQSLKQTLELAYTLIPALLLATAAVQFKFPLLDQRRVRWFLLAYFAAIILLMLDLLHGMPVYLAMRGGATRDPLMEGSLINRNMVAMAALCWPAFQAFWLRREWGAAALLTVGMIVLVTGGSSESAMVGLLVGLITLAVAMVAPTFTRLALGIGVIVTFFGTIPAMEWLYSLDLIDRGTLPFSFLHRIEIWHYASNLVFERPLLGWGLDSSRSIAEKVILERGGYEFPVLPIHPHNAFLQVWLELGLVGVAFGIAIGLSILRGIRDLPRPSQPVALAAFAGTMAMISVAYGIWQVWWLGVLILSMLMIHVLARQHRVG
jgi:exopolysaccharide production protein ExoQ